MTELQAIQKRRSFFKKQICTANSISIEKQYTTFKERILIKVLKYASKKLLSVHDDNSRAFGLNVRDKNGCKE